MNHDYFVFNRLEDSRHESIIHYFRYHVPSREITEEDVNHGGKNYDKNLIAHLRIVAILFPHPVSASCTESRLKFSFIDFP